MIRERGTLSWQNCERSFKMGDLYNGFFFLISERYVSLKPCSQRGVEKVPVNFDKIRPQIARETTENELAGYLSLSLNQTPAQ